MECGRWTCIVYGVYDREFEHRLFFLMQQNYAWLWTDAGEQKTGHGTTNRNGIHGPFCLGFCPHEIRFYAWQIAATAANNTSGKLHPFFLGWIIWLVRIMLALISRAIRIRLLGAALNGPWRNRNAPINITKMSGCMWDAWAYALAGNHHKGHSSFSTISQGKYTNKQKRGHPHFESMEFICSFILGFHPCTTPWVNQIRSNHSTWIGQFQMVSLSINNR